MLEESLLEEACFALRSKLAVAMFVTTLVCWESSIEDRLGCGAKSSFPTVLPGKSALNANQLMYLPRIAGVKTTNTAGKPLELACRKLPDPVTSPLWELAAYHRPVGTDWLGSVDGWRSGQMHS
jgi:hypothetical protein